VVFTGSKPTGQAASAVKIGIAGLCAGAVVEQNPVRWTWLSTRAIGAASATALIVEAAGAGNRCARYAGAARGVELLIWAAGSRYAVAAAGRGARRTLTPTRRADVGLSRNGARGSGEVGSAPRLRRTREARPLSFCALAYTFRLFWSIRTEETLTEFGAATPTALGGPSHPWEGGQGAPYEGCTHQPDRPTARDAAASQSSSQLVEGVVGSFLAHRCPLFPKGGANPLVPPR